MDVFDCVDGVTGTHARNYGVYTFALTRCAHAVDIHRACNLASGNGEQMKRLVLVVGLLSGLVAGFAQGAPVRADESTEADMHGTGVLGRCLDGCWDSSLGCYDDCWHRGGDNELACDMGCSDGHDGCRAICRIFTGNN